MSTPVKTFVASDMMTVDNTLSSKNMFSNLKQALVETFVILLLFVVVVCGRSITEPTCINVLKKIDVLVWVAVFIIINTGLKTFYPRFDDQLLNASVFSIIYTLMAPLKVASV